MPSAPDLGTRQSKYMPSVHIGSTRHCFLLFSNHSVLRSGAGSTKLPSVPVRHSATIIFAECQVENTRQFFLFHAAPSSFFIACSAKFVMMDFESTLSNSLNNAYLIFLRILFYYFMQLQLKFNLYLLKFYNCT